MDRLLAMLYETASSPHQGGWATVLRGVAGEVGAEAACLLVASRHGGALLDLVFDIDVDPQAHAEYVAHYSSLDPWVKAGVLDEPVGSAWPSERFVPEAELVATEFYREYYGRHGWRHGAGVKLLEEPDGQTALLVAHRDEARGAFGADEIAVLLRLAPHLQRALRLRSQMDLALAQQAATASLLDRYAAGCLVVDRYGRVLRANRFAREVLAERDGLSLAHGLLRCGQAPRTQQLRRLISRAAEIRCPADGPPGGRMPVERASGLRPYRLEVVPVDPGSELWGAPDPGAVVLVTDPQRGAEPEAETLLGFFGLTPAEAELARLLAQGLSLQDIARRRNVSRDTVRTHLKHVFEKTGTRRQAELVRAILGTPPVGRGEAAAGSASGTSPAVRGENPGSAPE